MIVQFCKQHSCKSTKKSLLRKSQEATREHDRHLEDERKAFNDISKHDTKDIKDIDEYLEQAQLQVEP